jgi:hypothetical protein
LNFAANLFSCAFRLKLGVTSYFASNLFDLALNLVCGAFNTIFIHLILLLLLYCAATRQTD